MGSASSLKNKFERAAVEAAQPKVRVDEYSAPAPLPPAVNASGEPSAVGLKAKFEKLANPDPPKKTMGKVAWGEDRDQGKKKVHRAGFDPTKPPPPRSIDDLP